MAGNPTALTELRNQANATYLTSVEALHELSADVCRLLDGQTTTDQDLFVLAMHAIAPVARPRHVEVTAMYDQLGDFVARAVGKALATTRPAIPMLYPLPLIESMAYLPAHAPAGLQYEIDATGQTGWVWLPVHGLRHYNSQGVLGVEQATGRLPLAQIDRLPPPGQPLARLFTDAFLVGFAQIKNLAPSPTGPSPSLCQPYSKAWRSAQAVYPSEIT